MLRLPLAFAAAVLDVMLAVQLGYGGPSPRDDQIVTPGGGVKMAGRMQMVLWAIRPGTPRWPQVAKDLKLSDEQKQKINEWQDDVARESSWRAMQAGPTKSREQQQKLLMEILNPQQRERLKQIGLQSLGSGFWNLPGLIEELGLTMEQRMRIGRASGRFLGEQTTVIRDAADGSLSDAQWQAEKRKFEQARIQAMLEEFTPEQRQKFRKMTGKPADIDYVRSDDAQHSEAVRRMAKMPSVQPPTSRLMLLRLTRCPVVQEELILSDQQKEKANEWKDLAERRQAPWGADWPDWGAGLSELLKHEQLKRLREIWLQEQPAALRITQVAEELGITAKQAEQIAELHRVADKEEDWALRLTQFGRASQQEVAEMKRKAKQQFRDRALRVLKPEQQRKYEDMMGKKIDLDLLERS